MSQPWREQIRSAIVAERFRLSKEQIALDGADVMEVLEPWLNAFDALLAVAKACHVADPDRKLSSLVNWSAALSILDAAHPDWRTWTP